MSAWLSYLWNLPPSVTLMIALVTAATVLIIVSEIRGNSISGKMVLDSLYTLRFVWNLPTQSAMVQLRGVFKNNDPLHRIYYRLDTLHLSIQGRTYGNVQQISDVLEIAPQGDAGYIFWGIDGVVLGPIDGKLHYRVKYGKSPTSLNKTFEQKIALRGLVLVDANDNHRFDLNWIIEETL